MVDPTSNFILSGSLDASVHVWSLVSILSFAKPQSGQDQQQPNSPIRTISNHRAAITSISVGHSAGQYNIAVSTSKDNMAIVWNYHTGRLLRTFLLPSVALCTALDPADRAFYVGYEDGSVQEINLYKDQSVQHPLYDPSLQSTPAQVSAEDRWSPPSADIGAVHSLSVSYDGTMLLSGHESGKVLSWNIGRRKYTATMADYTHPVTNLLTLLPGGLPHSALDLKRMSHSIIKPRYDHGLSDQSAPGAVPGEYAFNTHILTSSPSRQARTASSEVKTDQFSEALTHPFFPSTLIEEGLAELASLGQPGPRGGQVQPSESTGETTANGTQTKNQISSLETELTTLRQKASVNENARQNITAEMMMLRSELTNLQDYVNQLHEKQEQSHRKKTARQARGEQRGTKRRESWFAAEKKGKSGDDVVRAMKAEEEDNELDE